MGPKSVHVKGQRSITKYRWKQSRQGMQCLLSTVFGWLAYQYNFGHLLCSKTFTNEPEWIKLEEMHGDVENVSYFPCCQISKYKESLRTIIWLNKSKWLLIYDLATNPFVLVLAEKKKRSWDNNKVKFIGTTWNV